MRCFEQKNKLGKRKLGQAFVKSAVFLLQFHPFKSMYYYVDRKGTSNDIPSRKYVQQKE